MQKIKVFIDGKAGTTGLKIFERFANRDDIEVLQIDEDKRKDPQERKKLMSQSDVVFLCLPDKAAIEAVELAKDLDVRVIDASTAHRTNPDWAYGFPELSSEHREALKTAKYVANPGCHATGFISTVYPLVKAGLLPKDYPLVCHSITGYSGGGNSMIAEYEDENRDIKYSSPRQYGLSLSHKHIPEMMAVTGITRKPIFNPIVADFPCGMAVSVGLHNDMLKGHPTAQDIHKLLCEHYKGQNFVKVMSFMGDEELSDNFLASNTKAGTNELEIFVFGNESQTNLVARFDNLGKGASGAAVQCMNIMFDIDEQKGLI